MILPYFGLLSILTVVCGAPVDSPSTETNELPNGVISFNINQKLEPVSLLQKRDLTNNTVEIINQFSYYTVDFRVGTPAQNVTAVLDTGSSDLWFYDKKSGHIPFYDSNSSTSYEFANDNLFITYGSGPVMGNWGRDTVEFNNIVLKNTTLGLVTRDRLAGGKIPGILGVGKITNEATEMPYPNIPQLLYERNITQKNVYSIALSKITSTKGTILFGGIDSSKYTGPLYTVPMAKDAHLAIKLSEISFANGSSFSENMLLPPPETIMSNSTNNGTKSPINHSAAAQALLDTGTSFMYLPDKAVDQIIKRLGAEYYPQYGVYFVNNITDVPPLSFSFSGARITVPVSEYIVPAPMFTTDKTPGPYILTVFKSSLVRGYVILGGTFLRSAYMVFDLTDNQVSIAQADHSGTRKSEVTVISGQVPGAIPAPGLTSLPSQPTILPQKQISS